MSELPYVISAELELANQTALQPGGIERFRQTLDDSLRAAGKNTVWLGAEALRSGVECLVGRTALPVVSLDERYVTGADAVLGMSRAVDESLEDAGYDARLGFAPLDQQLDELARRYTGQEIALADDVLFTGDMVVMLQAELADRDVKLAALCCGVAIGDGAEKLQAQGIDVESAVTIARVDDEICERDFTLLYGSGRKAAGRQLSALYFDPASGKPQQWASIPGAAVVPFCADSLRANRELLNPDMPLPAFVDYPAGMAAEVVEGRLAEMSGT